MKDNNSDNTDILARLEILYPDIFLMSLTDRVHTLAEYNKAYNKMLIGVYPMKFEDFGGGAVNITLNTDGPEYVQVVHWTYTGIHG